MPDPTIGYGSVDKPFNEAFGIIKEVHWGGKAIEITSADESLPIATATCPSLLRQRGSWCTWIYAPAVGPFQHPDGFYGITDNPGTFQTEVVVGDIDPVWLDPGISADAIGLFPRGKWASDDNESHWTIRPDDSIAVVFIEESDNFYFRDDVSDMDFGKWHLMQMSWDVSTGAKTIAIDDAVKTVVYEPDPFTGIDDGTTQDDTSAIPSAPSQIALMWGMARRYDWWLSTEFIDFSVTANRRRFITSDKKAVPLGATGSSGSPTNRRPEFFFHPGSNLTGFSNNRGTGGPVVWTTELGLLTSTPIDPVWSAVAKPVTAGT